EIIQGEGTVYEENGLISVKPKNNGGIITLAYRPAYFNYVVLFYVVGILILISVVFRFKRSGKAIFQ
ncbi:MAG TPA: hypothetical protein VNX68_01560, partial [Nitrosopumilaceae archaeon]|nr:hypothetical protein [Nitrosopumilaceae archaeon]